MKDTIKRGRGQPPHTEEKKRVAFTIRILARLEPLLEAGAKDEGCRSANEYAATILERHFKTLLDAMEGKSCIQKKS